MLNEIPDVYLAWQDSDSRSWFVVGRLRRRLDALYEFVYTRGYEQARQNANMQPILGFMDSRQRYLSDKLFPLFQNRLMSPSREEYTAFLERLGLGESPRHHLEPLQVLARSGGRRVTDSFKVFPAPLKQSAGGGRWSYVLNFFVHGIRYVPAEAQKRVSQCEVGERLLLLADWQNEFDPNAMMLRTRQDGYLLGWLPRYYCADIAVLRERKLPISVVVERVNSVSSPTGQRLLCRLTAPWPENFRAFDSPEYEPLSDTDDEASMPV